MSQMIDDILHAVSADRINIEELASALDMATHRERVKAMRAMDAASMRRLYLAAEGRPVPYDYMVPNADELREVIHVGQNSLPAFRSFQKRFCRPSALEDDGTPMLWGYNHNWHQPFSTPGYFVGYNDDRTGEFVIDYTHTPPEKPSSWPRITDNSAKLGRFIYQGMVDRLWRVSSHVTIGRAFRGGPTPNVFTLVRED